MWWEIKNHLEIKNNNLFIANKNANFLARKYSTPLYVLNLERVRDNYNRLFLSLQKYLNRKVKILFPIKANSAIPVLKTIKSLGGYIDAVSPYEVLLAKHVGFKKNEVLFTGTSVSNEDMLISARHSLINIDSLSQLKRYSLLVKKFNLDPRISIRVNPEIGAGFTSDCITAGKAVKFGIPTPMVKNAYAQALRLGLIPIGIHQHIGSGILAKDLRIFLQAAEKILDIVAELKNDLKIKLSFVDIGGGLGIPYRREDKPLAIESFAKKLAGLIEAKVVKHNLGDFELYLEPGRYIVGDAEVLLVKAVDVSKKYVNQIGVDAGFNILDRPARYKTYHEIVNATRVKPAKVLYQICGNLCESGDVFTESKYHLRRLPLTKEGDILAILNAGAYGYTMSSNYNLRPRAKEIMIDKNKIKVIRNEEKFEDLIRNQIFKK